MRFGFRAGFWRSVQWVMQQLIVGVAFAIVGALLVKSGTSDIEPDSLTPERTTEQLRRDANLAKEQIQ